MKYLIYIFIISIGLSSCMTERKCNNKYPQKVIVKDSIVYKLKEVIIHDTLYLAGDTIAVSDTVYVDNVTGLLTSNRIYSETEYAKAWAQIINNKLFLELIQKDTAIARVIKENIEIKEVYVTKTIEVNKWIHHWYDKPAYIISIIFILAVLVLIAMKIIKMYIKPF